jgi:hypothetical protein
MVRLIQRKKEYRVKEKAKLKEEEVKNEGTDYPLCTVITVDEMLWMRSQEVATNSD